MRTWYYLGHIYYFLNLCETNMITYSFWFMFDVSYTISFSYQLMFTELFIHWNIPAYIEFLTFFFVKASYNFELSRKQKI